MRDTLRQSGASISLESERRSKSEAMNSLKSYVDRS